MVVSGLKAPGLTFCQCDLITWPRPECVSLDGMFWLDKWQKIKFLMAFKRSYFSRTVIIPLKVVLREN